MRSSFIPSFPDEFPTLSSPSTEQPTSAEGRAEPIRLIYSFNSKDKEREEGKNQKGKIKIKHQTKSTTTKLMRINEAFDSIVLFPNFGGLLSSSSRKTKVVSSVGYETI